MESLLLNSTSLHQAESPPIVMLHMLLAPGYVPYIFTIALISIIAYCWPADRYTAKLPLINPKAPYDLFNFGSRKNYILNAPRILAEGIKKAGKTKPFRVMTEKDEMIILPATMAHDIRNDPNLGFNPFIAKTFHAGIHGFEPLAENVSHDLLVDMVKSKLTPAIGQVTEPMADEMSKACTELLTEDTRWHEVVLKNVLLDVVSRLSSRVFMGEELCRNPEWLKLTKEYTVCGPMAATFLHLFPRPLRPLMACFLPITRALRRQLRQSLAIMQPFLEKRRLEKEAFLREGKSPKAYADAAEWFEQVAKGTKFNAHYLQLGLAFAAVHSSADALNHAMLEILQKPEIIQPMREEIISVLGTDEWSKRTLFKLRLMDSVLKESQRLKPVLLVTMNREALRDTTLPDGTLLKKGEAIGVASHCMRDQETWDQPNVFDPYRFVRMREDPKEENSWQFASTSSRHLGFGHGDHGCPGRFFVSHELKIALCHLLLKYDWKLAPGCKPQIEEAGYFLNSDSKARVMLRRRKEEIPL